MTTKAAVCRHHWLLSAPIAGVGSPGRCTRCGASRIHSGGLPDEGAYFNNQNATPAAEARRAARVREAELRRDPDAVEWTLE